jgi:outer membrane protein
MNNLIIKKSLIPCLTMAAITLAGASLSSPSFANDIAHTIRNSTEDNSTTENYFELGVGLAVGVSPSLTNDDDKWAGASLIINGSYSWNGVFIEKYGESSDPIILGYKAYENENWSLDIVMGPKFGGLHSHKKFEQLNDRNSSTMFGGRLTGTLGDNIVQFSLKHDISGNSHGTSASALVGRNWQVRNWNLHGLVGLSFFDSRINDYYYGINEDEASRTQFTEYRPGSNVNFSSEAGVTYPITENWVFRSTARFGTVSDADTDSPIFETSRSTAMSLRTSLTYVF